MAIFDRRERLFRLGSTLFAEAQGVSSSAADNLLLYADVSRNKSRAFASARADLPTWLESGQDDRQLQARLDELSRAATHRDDHEQLSLRALDALLRNAGRLVRPDDPGSDGGDSTDSDPFRPDARSARRALRADGDDVIVLIE